MTALRAETTIYVNKHFEVRDDDAPVKYVFQGETRVARVTGSLAGRERIQRFRLRAGWNLAGLAVDAADLDGQLRRFEVGDGPVVRAVYRWDPATAGYQPIAPRETAPAGSVLWISAGADRVVSVKGGAVEGSGRIREGGAYAANPGFEARTLTVPAGVTIWKFEAASGEWRAGLAGDLAAWSDLPPTLAPGEAIYVHTRDPVELWTPDTAAQVRYYHQDHLGSSSAISDANGELIEETAFYPFGIPRNEHRLEQIEESYTFTQKERDRESGLHYFEARYLAGTLSRFVTADPKYINPDTFLGRALTSFLSDPQKINVYAYVGNNPLKYTDPMGLDRPDGVQTRPEESKGPNRGVKVDADLGRVGNGVDDAGIAGRVADIERRLAESGKELEKAAAQWEKASAEVRKDFEDIDKALSDASKRAEKLLRNITPTISLREIKVRAQHANLICDLWGDEERCNRVRREMNLHDASYEEQQLKDSLRSPGPSPSPPPSQPGSRPQNFETFNLVTGERRWHLFSK